MRRIGLGFVGAGTAARASAPAFARHPGFHIVGCAEPDPAARDDFAHRHDATGYPDLAALLAAPDVDAVYVATPTQLHAAQVIAAVGAGKHVVVEKPMAGSLADAEAMVAAAHRAGCVLVVGHSHSFDLPVQRMRAVIASGWLGRVRMINSWCFSDWVYRPRLPEELDPAQGGSVLFRQGSHQFDVARLLGGGIIRSLQAQTFDFDPARSTLGAHMAMVWFEGGAGATIVYNGYGGLPGAELCGGIGEWGFQDQPKPRTRQPLSPAAEQQAKRDRSAAQGDKAGAPFQPHFGLTVVSCERGDIRQSPTGLLVYGPDGREEITLDTDASPHALVAAEFHAAICGTAPALHDGRWGLANLEACDAAWRSARSGAPVSLHHQVAVPA